MVEAPGSESDKSVGSDGSGESGEIQEILAQLKKPVKELTIQGDGWKLPVTKLDKELWPEFEKRRALTKRDLFVYFATVSEHILKHTRDRPLTLTRYPNGIKAGMFYQRHWEHKLPDFVERIMLFSDHNDADTEHMMCNNLPSLLWL